MKRLIYFMVLVLMALLLLTVATAFAQTPKVPITYIGDTEETIARRAQWIEGAKKEGTLTFWGTLRPDRGVRFMSEFKKIYPFIKTSYWRGRGEEIATKLEAEYLTGNSPVDVCHGGEPSNYPRWRKMGMMVPYTHIIPRIEKIDKRLYGKYGDWALPGHTVVTMQYNSNLVPVAEVPKKWEDMLDPKWKGQIGMSTDVKAWVTLALGEGGWGVERTEKFLRKLGQQNPVWGAGHTTAHTLMIAGEFKLNAEGYLYHILNSKRKGAPTEMILANPALVLGPSVHLSKKARHPNAGKLFLEWLFSPQGLKTWEEVSGGMGAALPGLGTQQSKMLEGVSLVVETEDLILKGIEMGLHERFSKALGIKK